MKTYEIIPSIKNHQRNFLKRHIESIYSNKFTQHQDYEIFNIYFQINLLNYFKHLKQNYFRECHID